MGKIVLKCEPEICAKRLDDILHHGIYISLEILGLNALQLCEKVGI